MVGAMSTRLVAAAAVPDERPPSLTIRNGRVSSGPQAAMLAAADRRGLACLRHPAPAGNAVGIRLILPRHVDRGDDATARGEAAVGQARRSTGRRPPTAPVASRRGRPAVRRARGRGIEQRRVPCPAIATSPASSKLPQAVRRQPVFEVDAVADRLVAVVGADEQQDLVALAAQPLDRAMDLGHAALGFAQHVGMRGRAQRHAMQRVVGVADPEESHGRAGDRTALRAQKRWVIAQSPAESWVTSRAPMLLPPGAYEPGAMMDVAEMLGIEEIGGARRDVREGDEAARAWRRARRSRAPAACRRWRGACACGNRARRHRARRSCRPP